MTNKFEASLTAMLPYSVNIDIVYLNLHIGPIEIIITLFLHSSRGCSVGQANFGLNFW